MTAAQWKASRFNARTLDTDGTLIIYNSASGSFAGVPPEFVQDVTHALAKNTRLAEPLSDLYAELALGGFLVGAEVDESEVVQRLIDQRVGGDRTLHLILLPTEDCNFRCVYCYELFKRHHMKKYVQDGVVQWLEANAHRFDAVHVEWFGGEPLFAKEVVLDLGRRLKAVAEQHGLAHVSSMTTNGYYLTPELTQQLMANDCSTFTITLDGLQEDHDAHRMLNGGGNTFDVIIENMRGLRATDWEYRIRIRHNFDATSLQKGDEFIGFLAENFGGDPRFDDINLRQISKWNGPNDSNFEICEAKNGLEARYRLLQTALKKGFYEHSLKQYFQPGGYVCYASNPNSLVIGADGKIMKCTLELDTEERNIVGHVTKQGDFTIDTSKLAAWVLSGSDDSGCRSCYFSPSCQGAACAKERFDHGIRPCPTEKRSMSTALKLLYHSETQAAEAALA